MKHYKDPATNEIYAYEADGSQDAFIKPGLVPIADSEASAIRQAKEQAAFNALNYSEKRRLAYPSIPDQLDTLYHGGYDAWKATIQAVKDKYPKE